MSDRDKSKEELIEELVSLRQEVAKLQSTKAAFDAQNELLRTLVTMMRTTTGPVLVRALLHQMLKTCNKLTSAEESSLFLLDTRGTVTESILARGATIPEQKQNLIDKVLDKGLAGWVSRNRQVGLITDTMNDDRWLKLPGETYTARSALCVPIVRGKILLGVITLMHSQPEHFSLESAHLMQMTADQMALVLDNAQLYIEHQHVETESHKPEVHAHKELDKLDKIEEQPPSHEELSLIGIFILGDGKFLYANHRLAEMFGYTFAEFSSLESILALVARDNRNFVANKINQCLQGQGKSLFCTFRGKQKNGNLINVAVYGTKTKFYGKSVIIGVLSLT